MKILPWIIVAVVILVAIYFISKNKKSTAISNSAAALPACIPFTKAQQDAEKRDKQAKCASKALIPFVGQVQYFTCMKNVETSLTPINNC